MRRHRVWLFDNFRATGDAFVIGDGIRTVNATGRNQVSYEDRDLHHGIFTCALLTAINGEAAGPDGLISVCGLPLNTTRQLMAKLSIGRSIHEPSESGEANGDMLVSASAATPRQTYCDIAPTQR